MTENTEAAPSALNNKRIQQFLGLRQPRFARQTPTQADMTSRRWRFE